jgi:hypothetical protein
LSGWSINLDGGKDRKGTIMKFNFKIFGVLIVLFGCMAIGCPMDSPDGEEPSEITGFSFTPATGLREGNTNTAPGAAVGTFSNPQGGAAPYSYSLVSGEGDNNNGLFVIEGTNLKAGSSAVTAGSYSVRVRVTGSDGKSFSLPCAFVVGGPDGSITGFDFNTDKELREDHESVHPYAPAGTFSNPQGGAAPYTYLLVSGEGDTHNGLFLVEGTTLKVGSSALVEGVYSVRVQIVDVEHNVFTRICSLTVMESFTNLTYVQFSLTANGSELNTTTTLTLVFDQDITQLDIEDITITDTDNTGAVKGTLSPQVDPSYNYELTLTGIKKSGSIEVALAKSGYQFNPAARINVSVYFYQYKEGDPLFLDGEENVTGELTGTGGLLAKSLRWIRVNGEDNHNYTIKLNADETFDEAIRIINDNITITITTADTSEVVIQSPPNKPNRLFAVGRYPGVDGCLTIDGDNTELVLDGHITLQGKSAGWTELVLVDVNGTLTMNGNSKMTGNGTVAVEVRGSGSSLVMNGNSSITDNHNTSYLGDGVFVYHNSPSSFHKTNIAPENITTFVMNDNASITNNSTGNDGGGVYVWGDPTDHAVKRVSFEMNGNAIVSDNTAKYGGGVDINNGTFTMNGGSIADNTATENGGGVYIKDSRAAIFAMSGGSIYGNTAKSGGGVYLNQYNAGGINRSLLVFTKTGGRIAGNPTQFEGLSPNVASDLALSHAVYFDKSIIFNGTYTYRISDDISEDIEI